VARIREVRKVYKFLMENPETTRKIRRGWELGIRMDLGEIGWGVEWI
jgi:hypothetical protein